MKYSKIILFFNIALVLSTIMRFLQIEYTIDFSTGFFKSGYEGYGYFILGAILLSAVLTIVFSSLSHRKPERTPRPNIVLSIISFLPAIAILYDVLSDSSMLYINQVQSLLLKITGIAAAVFFIIFGLNRFIAIGIPDISYVIPCVYVIIKIICDFTSISSLALISDNIFLIVAYCLVLLFFINFAKLYNSLDTEYNFRKLKATGLSAALICISQSVAYIIVNIIRGGSYNHISVSANLGLLAIGLFILTFIYSHYSNVNMD